MRDAPVPFCLSAARLRAFAGLMHVCFRCGVRRNRTVRFRPMTAVQDDNARYVASLMLVLP